MPNEQIEITVIDVWPRVKLLINQGGGVRTEGPFQYDIAASQFTPAVVEAMTKAVDKIIRLRRS